MPLQSKPWEKEGDFHTFFTIAFYDKEEKNRIVTAGYYSCPH
jgi:hypothetical protein